MYKLYGFDQVSNVEFYETFAPNDWNYERDVTPDVVFWLHNGNTVGDVLLNFGGYDIDWDSLKKFLHTVMQENTETLRLITNDFEQVIVPAHF